MFLGSGVMLAWDLLFPLFKLTTSKEKRDDLHQTSSMVSFSFP